MAIETPYSNEVLEETPARATRFLAGIGALPIVRTTLSLNGMTDADIDEGRKLLLACLAEPRNVPATPDTDEARASREAVVELDAWDEPNFGRYAAALKRKFPSTHAYVFADLKASTGAAAVNGVATFLARVDALDKGTDASRSDSKKADAAAVALLDTRGLTKTERKRLRGLVDTALGPTSPLEEMPAMERDEVRVAKLVALKEWYEDWTATTRAVIKKRVYLIRMGLASRKVRRGTEDVVVDTGDPPEPTPTPI
jgi:hypothetical protein